MSVSEEWLQALDTGFNNRYIIVRHGQSEANVAKLVSSIYSVSVANHGLTPVGVEQATNAVGKFVDLTTQPTSDEDLLGSTVVKATTAIQLDPTNLDNVVFYVSDFKRAYETGFYLKESLVAFHLAEVKRLEHENQTYTPAFIQDQAKNKSITLPQTPKYIPFYSSTALRERFFGVFEGACPSDDLYDQIWALDKSSDVDSQHHAVESIQSVVTRTTELILELEQIWKDKIIILVSHGDVTQIVQAVFAAIDPRFHRSLPHMENCDVRELLLVKGGDQ